MEKTISSPILSICPTNHSAIDIGGAGGARAPPEFGGSEKGQSLISAYRCLSITASTSGFEKLSRALNHTIFYFI